MKRVTDLEKFALEEIWRPYSNMMGHDRRLERLPMSLDETVKLLVLDETGWAECVLNRISAIGFSFPAYIVHPLTDLVRTEQHRRRRPQAQTAPSPLLSGEPFKTGRGE